MYIKEYECKILFKYIQFLKCLKLYTSIELGIYVDGFGRKSREKELMFPAPPEAVSKFQYVFYFSSP